MRPPTQFYSPTLGSKVGADEAQDLRTEVEALRKSNAVGLRAASYVRKLYDEVLSGFSIEDAGEREAERLSTEAPTWTI